MWPLLALLLPLAVAAGAPDMTLRDLDGRDRPLSEFIGRGQWVVVAVWSADCPICRREIHHLAFFHDEHHKKGASVLGLSVDGFGKRAKAQAFVREHGLSFPNLIGDELDAAALGRRPFVGTPTFYIYAPDGRFAGERVGAITQDELERWLESLKSGKAKGKG